VVGTAGGELVFFKEREAESSLDKSQCHTGPVLSLCETKDYNFIISGGKDGVIKIFNQSKLQVSSFNLNTVKLGVDPNQQLIECAIGSIDIQPAINNSSSSTKEGSSSLNILIGTYGGDIIEISTSSNRRGDDSNNSNYNLDLSDANAVLVQQSHFQGELWGLAVHPINSDLFATVGDDGLLRVWSISKETLVACVMIGKAGRSLAWHPSGLLLAVGLNELEADRAVNKKASASGGGGKKAKKQQQQKEKESSGQQQDKQEGSGSVMLFQFKTIDTNKYELKLRGVGCKSTACIADLKFSPLQSEEPILAVASHDKHLYAYKFPTTIPSSDSESEWKEISVSLKHEKYVFNKHSSAVLHIDFSSDGKVIQSNCQVKYYVLLSCFINKLRFILLIYVLLLLLLLLFFFIIIIIMFYYFDILGLRVVI
jgi:microtubule-associated protein-like 6